jgi:hypothetical protein
MKLRCLVVSLVAILGLCPLAFALETIDLLLEGDLRGLDASYKKKFEFSRATLDYKGERIAAEAKTRGQNCLKAQRKCFTLSLESPLPGLGKHVVLTSLSGDHGYINYVTGLKFMQRVGLSSLNYRYVHLLINQRSQGLYLLLENPKQLLRKEKNAVFIGRRQHWPKKPQIEFWDKESAPLSGETYQAAYDEMVSESRHVHGPALYQYLQTRMNIRKYLDWLALNSVLQNGDYDDELFYYAKKDSSLYFDFMGWDYEDLFSHPHFVNKLRHPFAIKKTLLYSVVNKLDRTIDRDSYLHGQFIRHLSALIKTTFPAQEIAVIFQEVAEEISPFLQDEILDFSRLDHKVKEPYSRQYILSLLATRQEQVRGRVAELAALTRPHFVAGGIDPQN